MDKILIIGADGQLGRSISRICDQFEGLMLFASRKDVDICNPESIRTTLASFQPNFIINCAAYTAVDKAESEEEKAFNINRDGLINLIKESEAYQSKIIHISTDYVFNGESKIPYLETDSIDPKSVYGFSKAAGEKALIDMASSRSFIIRTSWLYSEFGNNFLKTMLRLGKEKESLNVVEDQIGVPTYAVDLAHAIMDLIHQNPASNAENMLLHFSNSGISNWYEFAKEIMNIADLDCEINPIPTSAYPTPAKRPSFSVLDSRKIENILSFKIRPWKLALEDCMQTIKST